MIYASQSRESYNGKQKNQEYILLIFFVYRRLKFDLKSKVATIHRPTTQGQKLKFALRSKAELSKSQW